MIDLYNFIINTVYLNQKIIQDKKPPLPPTLQGYFFLHTHTHTHTKGMIFTSFYETWRKYEPVRKTVIYNYLCFYV